MACGRDDVCFAKMLVSQIAVRQGFALYSKHSSCFSSALPGAQRGEWLRC
jgi:hypothetical protein